MLKYPYRTFVSHYLVLQNVIFFAGKHFFIRKIKIKMADCLEPCAFKSCEKCAFTSQNILSDVL